MTDCAGCSRRLEPVSFKLLDASVGPDQLPQLGPGTQWSSEAVHWQSPAPDTDNWQYCEPVAAPALKVGPEYWARPLVSDKFSVAWPQSLSDNWPTHTDTLYRDILLDNSDSDPFMWPRHCLISDWTLIPIIFLSQRNGKWSKVCGKSQNVVFLRKESLLWGGPKFQCWHWELFGEWTSFYRNCRIEIASDILILFESEYTHFIEC